VARSDRGHRQATERRKEWLRYGPSVVIALILHGGLLWWYATLPAAPGPSVDGPLRIESFLLDPLDWEEAIPPALSERVLEEPDADLGDPEILDSALMDSDAESSVDVIGAGGGAGSGGGRGGVGGGGGAGPRELEGIGPEGSPFRQFVEDLRRRGLDVVFVVDATASMGPFIVAARATVDEIIVELATVVPSLRLGIVAYRDHEDDWLVRSVELTDDRYQIHNFLLDLEAQGGGDFPEALDEGLRVAIRELSWRPGARRVIIIVGDAPVHPENETAMNSMIRGFARDKNSLVNVLYTGADPNRPPTEQQARARKSMERVAKAGGGLLAELMTEGDDLRMRITDATFGTAWRQEIARLIGRDGADPKQRIVDRKLEARDRRWFLRNLSRTPVHPAIVNGSLTLFDAEIGAACLDLVLDEGAPQATRSVALHILKRSCAPGVELDVADSLAGQPGAVTALRRAVEKLVLAVPPTTPAPVRPLPPPR
jgi:Mg-chelatase subunit ChlD